MDVNPDTLVTVLANDRDGTRLSKVGFGCMMFINFLRGAGIYTINNAVSLSGHYFGLSDSQMRVLFVVHFANSYVSPVVVALFADLVVGKYRAIFLSAGMRIFASLTLTAIALICHYTSIMNPGLKSFLFGVYVFSLMFLFVSVEFETALIMPFTLQQVNQVSNDALMSGTKWNMWTYCVGVVSVTLVTGYLRQRYYNQRVVVEMLAGVITASLMISSFILGKRYYKRNTCSEGRASGKAIWRIISTRFCCRPRYQNLDEPMSFRQGHIVDQYKVHQQIKMERLILRKICLMFVFFACLGVGQVIYFKILFVRADGWKGHVPHAFTSNLTLLIYVPCIVIIPIWDYITRRYRSNRDHFAGARRGRDFVTMGIGLVMTALASLSSGLFYHFKDLDNNGISWQSMWQMPAFLILGFNSLLTYLKALEFCYTESFKGLECCTNSLLASLWMLLYSIITWTEVKWNHDPYNMEIFYFALFGAMVCTILFIYIPVSVWYTKVKREIGLAITSITATGCESPTENSSLINWSITQRVPEEM